MVFTEEQIKEVQEKRGLSRAGARQFLARQAKQGAKSAPAVASIKQPVELNAKLAKLGDKAPHIAAQAAKEETKASPKTKMAQPKPEISAVEQRHAKAGIHFDIDKAVKMYKAGETISAIAQAMGFKKGTGNNYTHKQLVDAGARKARPSEK